MQHRIKARSPVNIILVFALVLLSPLPFLSPFSYDNQTVQALPFNNPNLPDASNSVDQPVTTTQTTPVVVQSIYIDPTGDESVRYLGSDGVFTITIQTQSNITNNSAIAYGTGVNTLINYTGSAGDNANELVFILDVLPGLSGNITFSVNVTTVLGESTTITDALLNPSTAGSSNYITADSKGPEIILNGDSNVTVYVRDNFTDTVPNYHATVTDLDSNYNSDVTSNADDFNFSVTGTYTIVYSANADSLGNIAPNVTRTVTVNPDPIGIISLNITSSSGDNFANASKNITVSLDTDSDDLGNFSGTFLGRSFTNTTSGGNATFTIPVLHNDTDGNATFSINMTNSAGSTLNITNSDITDTDNSFVIIDTMKPMITLNGLPPYTVRQEGTYTDPGANATDLNYPSSPQAATASPDNLDTSSLGPQNITYSGPADAAGNVPDSVTRTVTVYAVNPIPVTTLNIASSSGNNFANASKTITVTLDAESNDLGNFTGIILGKNITDTNPSIVTINNATPGTATFTTTVLPTDTNGNITFSITATNSTGSTLFITNSNITDNSFVTIDTEKPVITLNGTSLVTIIQEDNYSDQGATVEDINNPSYTGNVVTTFATPLNTSVLGDTIITYTAPADAAGNVPDSKTRTVRVVMNDTIVDGPSSSSSSSITLGLSPFGDLLVKEGFEYNGLAVNVTGYHTEFPLIDTHVGAINIVKIKIYDTVGPTGVQRLEFALSVPEIGLYHDSEVFIEVWMQRDNISVSEVVIVDPLNLLENSDVSVMASETSCTGDKTQCLLVEMQYSYREPPIYNAIAIKPVNWDDDARQFYFNDGIHVDGESENQQKEIDISPSHAINIAHTDVTLHLVQIDRAEHLWVDQYGHKWMIIGNNVRQITMDGHVVPDDNTYGGSA